MNTNITGEVRHPDRPTDRSGHVPHLGGGASITGQSICSCDLALLRNRRPKTELVLRTGQTNRHCPPHPSFELGERKRDKGRAHPFLAPEQMGTSASLRVRIDGGKRFSFRNKISFFVFWSGRFRAPKSSNKGFGITRKARRLCLSVAAVHLATIVGRDPAPPSGR